VTSGRALGDPSAWMTAIPGTLRELLMARLDALSVAARETAQLAAAIGREVRHDLLAATAERDEGFLRRDVRELIDARLLQQRRSTADESYVFRHALVRDAAYESMLRVTRQGVHRRIAATIRERFPDVLEQQPELVAHHLEAGDELMAAVASWQRAGDRALRRANYAEARQHLERGLAVLERLPRSADRTRAEVELLTSLGTVLLSTQGFAAPEVEATFGRARALCDRLGGDVPPKILSGIIGVTITRGDREGTDLLLPHLHRFASAPHDVVDEVTGYTGLGIEAFWRGAHASAKDYFERARPAYRSDAFQQYVREYGYDGGMFSYAYSALNDWVLGFPREAEETCRELLAIAEGSTDPHARSLALGFAVHVAFARRDADETIARSERLLAIAGVQKLYFWMALGLCGHGVGLALRGAPADGIPEIRQGIELTNMMGARLVYGYYLVFLIDALIAAGELEEAQARSVEGLALCAEQGGRFYEPELLRLQAVLHVARGEAVEAEATARRAVAMAGERGAASWALRAATTLAELLRGRGEPEDARLVLDDALSPFSDDVDGPDLRAARALRATLA
jgi:tetratricopeptide (TPR) repeat protein